MIVIIDYGMGNLGSIANMLKQIGAQAEVTNDPQKIESAERLILAGVGAFDQGMQRLNDLNLIPLMKRKVLEQKTPFIGICLGMQLLSRGSEEGDLPGLGWLDAETLRFNFDSKPNGDCATPPATRPPSPVARLRVPHMGWNEIQIQKQHALLNDLGEEPRFYFVHSYYVKCNDADAVLACTDYGLPFHSILGKGNILGTQFHPEKSHRYGRKILENFVGWMP
ncbi:MAG: imidazole glycerol phosphate synthase subunit HisH [Chloroflexota bacterium]